MKNDEIRLFATRIGDEVYRISDSAHGPDNNGFSALPGSATANSYLVVGSESAALIDLAIDTPDLLQFAKELAGVPVKIILTHGHPDHIFNLENAGNAYCNPADFSIVRTGMGGIFPSCTKANLIPLEDGQVINLGDRKLTAHQLPGHTMGSVLLLDSATQILFAGDTCARRLLYGLTPTVSLQEHCQYLEEVKQLDFRQIYTAHDRCPLDKNHIDTILNCIREKLPKSTDVVDIPGFGKVHSLHYGREDTLEYFDMAVTEEYFDITHS